MNLNEGLLLAAISGALAGATACASSQTPTDDASAMSGGNDMASPGKHACKGQNECKGQGGCKTDKHACKGQNECKGQGGCKTL